MLGKVNVPASVWNGPSPASCRGLDVAVVAKEEKEGREAFVAVVDRGDEVGEVSIFIGGGTEAGVGEEGDSTIDEAVFADGGPERCGASRSLAKFVGDAIEGWGLWR